MRAVFINGGNKDSFVHSLNEDLIKTSDLLIGAVDEETDTACGILALKVTEDRFISIRHIYVHEEFRNKGAGRAMIQLLLEFADGSEANGIICSLCYSHESRGIAEFLMKEGFIADRSDDDLVYGISLGDLSGLAGDAGEWKIISLKKHSEDDSLFLLQRWQELNGSGKGLKGLTWADESLSFIAYDEEDDPCGALLSEKMGDSLLIGSLETTDTKGEEKNSEKIKKALLSNLMASVKGTLPDNAEVKMTIHKDDREEFLVKIKREELEPEGVLVLFRYDL